MDASASYRKGSDDSYTLHCPGLPRGAYGYAFNADLSGASVPKRAEDVPLVYESTNLARGTPPTGLPSFPSEGRRRGRMRYVAYGDGHARQLPRRVP